MVLKIDLYTGLFTNSRSKFFYFNCPISTNCDVATKYYKRKLFRLYMGR